MIKGKFEVKKVVFKKEGFNIYGIKPIEMLEGDVVLNKYNNVTLKTSMDLTAGHIYTLVLEEGVDNYGVFYDLIATGFDFQSIDEITPETHLDLLRELTSPSLAETIHKAYPNFIRLILEGKVNEIDVNKIKGVKYKLLDKFTKKIQKNCIMFMLMNSYPDLKLTPKECRSLVNHFGTLELIKANIDRNPYDTILKWTTRSFYALDRLLGMEYRQDEIRLKWLVEMAISQATYDGSTYTSTKALVDVVNKYDPDIIHMLPQIVENLNDDFIYIKEKGIIQTVYRYNQEKSIADFIKTKLDQTEKLNWDWGKFTKVKDGTLTKEQQGALKMICENELSLLVGYSGCGKTSTVKAILQMLEHYDQSYLLLAPTGKASQRLAQQTGRKASTIHKATTLVLADKAPKLTEDWIIVDEMSMVSLDVLQMIIDSTSDITKTRFLFIGDSGQIPSIGTGSILRDCIQSNKVPVTTLTHCFRFAEGGASYVAECMRQGKTYLPENVPDYYTMGKNEDYVFIKWDRTREQIVNTYIQAINNGVSPQDICLLVPYNKGDFGTTVLNNDIQAIINPIKPNDTVLKTVIDNTPVYFHKGDTILVTKNNYKTITWQDYDEGEFDDLTIDDMKEMANGITYNGQVGFVTNIINDLLVVKIEGEEFVFTDDELRNLKLGYCLSVHKFQGSECPYIINVAISPHSNMLSRELEYTAQTRFSKRLIEIGTIESLEYAMQVSAQDERLTRLKEFIINE